MDNYLKYIEKKSACIINTDEGKGIKLCDVYKNLNDSQIEKVKEIGGEVAGTYWDQPLSRKDVREMFKDVYKGFIAAMLWGGLGSNGQSFNHLEKALEKSKKEEVIRKLNRVKDLISQGNIGDAFLSMCFGGENKIDGIDVSYFTKILFFMSDINSFEEIPLIYDKWGWHIHAAILLSSKDERRKEKVLTFFNIMASLKKDNDKSIINPAIILPLTKKRRKEAYEDYIKVMHRVSKTIGNLSPGNLEQYLFGYSRVEDNTEKNPRVVLVNYLNTELTKLIKEAEIKVTEDGIDSIDKEEAEDGIYDITPGKKIMDRPPVIAGKRIITKGSEFYLFVGKDSRKVFCDVLSHDFQYPDQNKLVDLLHMGTAGKKKPYYKKEFKENELDEAKKFMDKVLDNYFKPLLNN